MALHGGRNRGLADQTDQRSGMRSHRVDLHCFEGGGRVLGKVGDVAPQGETVGQEWRRALDCSTAADVAASTARFENEVQSYPRRLADMQASNGADSVEGRTARTDPVLGLVHGSLQVLKSVHVLLTIS